MRMVVLNYLILQVLRV